MVNLDAELNITAKAQGLHDQLVAAVNAVGKAITDLDLSGARPISMIGDGLLQQVTTAVEKITGRGRGYSYPA